ncbi:MAG: zinc-dependent dehydrogenase [Desulfobacca sp.]|nr:zinc-dependent dehydrogenase [Desulfobacca sp.]
MEMNAALLTAPKKLEFCRVPRPECPKEGLLINVAACSLCATDAKMWHQGHRDLILPRILGHEMAGTIVEVGNGVRGFQIGDRVQMAPGLPCGRCRYCLRGVPNLCQEMRIMGFHHDGGLAEFLAVPAAGVHQGAINLIPAALSFQVATLAEPLACCINGQEQAGVGPGEHVAIFGAGPIGLLHAQLAYLRGASRVILVELALDRIAQARQGWADVVVDAGNQDPVAAIRESTDGQGIDVGMLACRAVEAWEWALAGLAKRGRLCLFSGLPSDLGNRPVDLNRLHYLEATLVGAYGCTSRQNALALELLAHGRIPGEKLLTHRLPLTEVENGLHLVQNRQGLKVTIDLPGGED